MRRISAWVNRVSIILLVLVLLVFSFTTSAQTDETPTEPATEIPTEVATETPPPTDIPTEMPSPTAAPTDVPTELPTDTPTELPTAIATETVPELTPTFEMTATATDEGLAPTATLTPTAGGLQPEPELGLLFNDTFDSGDISHWTFGTGWAYTDHNGGKALQVFNSSDPGEFVSDDLLNVAAQASFMVDNGAGQISVRRSALGDYSATLDNLGAVNLYRMGVVLQSAAVAPSQPGQWRSLRLSAIGDTVRVAVDGIEVIAIQDAVQLPPGKVAFSGALIPQTDITLPQNTVQVDDFFLYVPLAELPAPTATPTVELPTATMTPTETPTLLPTPTVIVTQQFVGLKAIQTFTVNSTNDVSDGVCDATHCSLREAITAANANVGTDTIAFNIAGAGVRTIQPTSALPTITEAVIIDGTTQPGFAGSPLIELSGVNLGQVDGLTISNSNGGAVVRGLVINRFGGNGIKLSGGSYTTIEGNIIGLDATGTIDLGNSLDGVRIDNSYSNTIGGSTAAKRNLISGNAMSGVRIDRNDNVSSNGNVIKGNYIGTDVTGTVARVNDLEGVYVVAGASNYVGGTVGVTPGGSCTGDCNLITSNTNAIRLSGSSNAVYGNFIGLNVSGTAVLGNPTNGIAAGSGNIIGSGQAAGRNVIAGYQVAGISMSSGIVEGNYIGTDTTGTVDLVTSNAYGIYIRGGSYARIGDVNMITTGGSCAGVCNLISGNGIGIYISEAAHHNTIMGNAIGTDVTGNVALGNTIGISIESSQLNTIGGTNYNAGNLISGNTTDGISITGSITNSIWNNSIGTNASRTGTLGNLGNGIRIISGTANSIGASVGNTIAFNGGAGISIQTGTGNQIHGNSIFSNGGLGIDLLPAGVTPNDVGDADTGANDLQNYPVLTGAVASSLTNLTVTGTLNSQPNSIYRVAFYGTDTCDASGYGEGKTILGFVDVTTDASGNASFNPTLTGGTAKFITATANPLNNNTSEFSACISALNPPSNPTFTVTSPTSLVLNWVDNTDLETQYRVERSYSDTYNWTEIAVLPANTVTYTDNPITCNLPYSYRIRAYRGSTAQFSGYTSILNVRTACSLDAPTNLTLTNGDAGQVVLNWTDNTSNETSNLVERSPNGTDWTQIAELSASATTYSDPSVICENSYFYRVRAAHTFGQRSAYSNVANISARACKPTNAVSSAVSPSQIHIAWVDNSSLETSYKIERANGGTWVEVGSVGPNVTSYDDTGLTCNTQYQYRVKLYSGSVALAESDATSATTQLCAPADLSLVKTVNAPTAQEGGTVVYTLTLTNNSANPAPRVSVQDQLPASVSFVSATSSQGSYNSGSGTWVVGDVAANSGATLNITVRVKGGFYGQSIGNKAEIKASGASDPDSTPNNDVPAEDDQSEISFGVVCASASIFNVAAGDTVGLIAAMIAANNETCFPGSNTITLAANSVYTLTQVYNSDLLGSTGLPAVTSTIIIQGNSAVIERLANGYSFRILTVNGSGFSPNLTLNNLTIRNGRADSESGNPNSRAGWGGGILNQYGTVTLNNVTIDNNVAIKFGAGVYNSGTMTINGSLLRRNKPASFGIGAAITNDGILTVSNSTFTENTAGSTSSAIIFHNTNTGSLNLIHNTFVNNTAPILTTNLGSMSVRANLFIDTVGGAACYAFSVITSQGYNIADDGGCASFFTQPTDLNNVDIRATVLADNGSSTLSFAPFAASAAIDAIPAAQCTLTTDQRGFTRPVDGNGDGVAQCDVGAVEVGRADLVLDISANRTTTAINDQFDYTITYTNNGPDNALGVVVGEPLPTQLDLISSNATQGAYDRASGLWTIGQVNAGQTMTLTLTVKVNFSAYSNPIINEVTGLAASVNDPGGAPQDSISIPVNSCAASASFTIADGDTVSLVNAIQAANNETCYPGANTINLATNGTYTFTAMQPDPFGDANALPIITSEIIIEGNGSTLVRGGGAPQFRFFAVDTPGKLTLNALTLRNGSLIGGGAIFNSGTLTLNNSTLRANVSTSPGGAIDNMGSLTLTNTTVMDNTAPSGGAIRSQGTLSITGGSFTNNQANNAGARGGAIFITGGTATITNASFTTNKATSSNTATGGGAIYNTAALTVTGGLFSSNSVVGTNVFGGAVYNTSAGNLTVSNARFETNTAAAGGAIYNDYGVLNLSSSLLSGNTAGMGGGIYGMGTLTITNSTFSGNTGNNSGGALGVVSANVQIRFSTFNNNTSPSGSAIDNHGSVTITASILAGIAGNNCNDTSNTSGGYNISNDASCGFGATGDLNNINPLLDTLKDNGGPTRTFALLNGSLALNVVPGVVCTVATDQRGTARPQENACEIGAYEGSGVPSTTRFRVTNINSVVDTGDGKVDEGEIVDVPITQLIVTFNKPVQNPAGNSDPNDVTNPGNYRLISGGADHILQTGMCGIIAGDDQLIPINSVAYNAVSYTATVSVNGGAVLPSNAYRLVVCATIKDMDGNFLDANADGYGGDDFGRSFTNDAVNYAADLVVTQVDNPDPVLVGATLTYTITVANPTGPQQAQNVVLKDTIPAGVTFSSASAGCTYIAGVVNCNLDTILRGGSKSVTVTLTVGATTIATLSNSVSVNSTVTDPNPANNTNIIETTKANEPMATNLVVNTTDGNSDGVCGLMHCSLGDAVESANARPGKDTITFNIPGPGPYIIKPAVQMTLGEAAILDGWSQPGYVDHPIIQIDGVNAGGTAYGLSVLGGDSTVRGLVISNFSWEGLRLVNNGGNTIVGNYIGTNMAGTAASGNRGGILIEGSPNNIIGGLTPAERNVVSGNNDTGINITGGASAPGNLIQGNYIGTNAAGTAGLANQGGGVAIDAPNIIIGGTSGTTPGGNCTGACNLISYNAKSGIYLGDAPDSFIQGNFIGTDVTGKIILKNGSGVHTGNAGDGSGIAISGSTPTGTLIGGSTPAARNVISGNRYAGIYLTSNLTGYNTQIIIQGNYIGVDTTGTIALSNDLGGIHLYTINNQIIGNVISGNNGAGLRIDAGPNTIKGNTIGTNAAGTSALPNMNVGISINAGNLTIGGSTLADRNIISGNPIGISLSGSNNTVQGNYIGLNAAGTASIGNTGHGIIISGSSNTVGGPNAGEGNTIAYNTGAGIFLNYNSNTSTRIVGNSIFANGKLGINLAASASANGSEVTLNDPVDTDLGANKLQNFPVISSGVSSGGQVTLQGTLNSTPNSTFQLDFYANTVCDASGYGEGEIYLGNVSRTTDASGNVSFNVSYPGTYLPNIFYTATATDASGNTSEFSACKTAFPPPSNLLAAPLSQTSIHLTWTDKTSTEDGFAIERSPNGTSGWTQIATVGAGVTTYDDTSLICTSTYFYRVRASADAGAYYSAYSNVTSLRPCTQQGPVFTVTHVDGTDDGLCDLTHCTLREAINEANRHTGLQTINLATSAVYTFSVVDNSTNGANGLPIVTGQIVINGNGAVVERSSAGGTPQFRLFYIPAGGKLTLNDITVRNGYAVPAVWPNGGGVANNGGQLTLNRSTMTNNKADYGGAISNVNGGVLAVNNSTLFGNEGSYSGAAISNDSNYTVGVVVTVTNSTISGNLAGSGAGIYSFQGGTLTITHSTFANNTSLSGGTLYNGGSTFRLRATIISANVACYNGTVTSDGYNIISGTSCNLHAVGDINDTNPLLSPLADNGGPTLTHALQTGSPALDAIPAANCTLTSDQRGTARPQGDFCDVGAYEAQLTLLAPTGLSAQLASFTSVALHWTDTFNETEYRIERSPDGLDNWAQIATVSANVTTYTDTGVTCNTAYKYRVRAFRSAEQLLSGYSDIVTLTTGSCVNADLSVALAQANNPLTTGTQQTYTLTIHNAGPTGAAGIVVTDTLPIDADFVYALPSQGVCTTQNEVMTCQLGSLANGADITISIVATISPDARDSVTNIAAVTGDGADSNPANNTASISTDLTLPGLPGNVGILGPANGLTTNQPVVITWAAAANAEAYQVQLDTDSRFTSPDSDVLVDDTTFTAGDNLTSGRYYWRVRSVNSILQVGNWSTARSFTRDVDAPAAPTLTQPAVDAVITTSKPLFRWIASPTANRYRLQVADNDAFASPLITVEIGTTSYTSTVLLPQGSYYWHVESRDAIGNWSDYGATQTFSLNLQTSPVANGFVTEAPLRLQWAAYTGAIRYQVEVATDAAMNNLVTGYPHIVTRPGYTPSAMLAIGVYYWRVQVDIGSGFVASPFVRSFAVTPAAPDAPGLSVPANGAGLTDATPLLSWQSVTGATQYQIQIDDDSRFGTPNVDTLISVASYTPNTLTDGRYYWRVLSINQWGAPGVWSIARNFVVDTAVPDAPTLSQPLAAGMVSTARPTFRWVAAPTANRYHIQVAPNAAFTGLLIDTDVTSLSYLSTITLPQGSYYWHVKSRDAIGNWGSYGTTQTFSMSLQTAPAIGAFVTDTTPVLQWAAYTGATRYQVELATDLDMNNLVSGFPHSVTRPGYTVSTALPQGVYYWRVQVDIGSGFVASPFVRSFTITSAPPAAPRLSAPANGVGVTNPTPLLSWQTVTGATQYQIQIDDDSRFRTPNVDGTSATTSYTASVLNDGRYYSRVRSLNQWGAPGNWSSTRNFVIDTSAPAAPTLTQPAAAGMVSTARPTFRWLAAPTANRYHIQVAANAAFTSPLIDIEVGSVSYPSTVVLPQGVYYWHVQSRDAVGNWGGYGLAQTFSVSLQTAPTVGAFVTDTTPALQWAAYPGAVLYKVELATDAAMHNLVSGFPQNVARPGYTVPTALPQGVYYWRVQVDIGSGFVASPFVRSFTVTNAPPVAPRLTEPANNAVLADATPLLGWQSVTGATQYQIQIDNNANFSSPEADATVATLSHIPAALSDGRYYWRVRSLNQWGAPGAWSTVRSFTVDAP